MIDPQAWSWLCPIPTFAGAGQVWGVAEERHESLMGISGGEGDRTTMTREKDITILATAYRKIAHTDRGAVLVTLSAGTEIREMTEILIDVIEMIGDSTGETMSREDTILTSDLQARLRQMSGPRTLIEVAQLETRAIFLEHQLVPQPHMQLIIRFQEIG